MDARPPPATMSIMEPPTDRTRVRRHHERGRYDRATIDAILDEALICHLGVLLGGSPRVIPTIHARVDDTLYVHGSAASRTLRALRGGGEACVAVTLLDGLVLARSAFGHSMNYRSVIVFGVPREVTDPDEKWRAQEAVVEHVVPGRTAEARRPTEQELRQTSIFAFSLHEASAKVRMGPPLDPEEEWDLPIWAGEVPLRLMAGEPVPDPHLAPGLEPPGYARAYRRP